MAFPDAHRAVVSENKLLQYLLNFDHPVGGPKAAWFQTVGYTIDNADELRSDLLAVATADADFISKRSPHGVKYEAVGEIGRPPSRPGRVVTVWIVAGNDLPRLITAYPAD